VLYPVLNAHLVGIVAQEDRGRSNALFTATFNGGMLVFAFGLGFLIDLWASYRVAFNACAAAFVIAAVLVVAGRGERDAGKGGLWREG
jgi:MFS family permease